MASGPKRGVFLERASYRRRRLLDALKLLPFLGAWVFMLPLLWPASGGAEGGAQPMSSALIYMFGAWALLIVASALLLRGINKRGGVDLTPPPQE